MHGCKIQPHLRCGLCGKTVSAKTGNRKCDGWLWHFACWKSFLLTTNRREEKP